MRLLARAAAALLLAGIVMSFLPPYYMLASWPLLAAGFAASYRHDRRAAKIALLTLAGVAAVALLFVGVGIGRAGRVGLPRAFDDAGFLLMYLSVILPPSVFVTLSTRGTWARGAKAATWLIVGWALAYGGILTTEAIRGTHITFEAHILLLVAGGLITIALLVARTIGAAPRDAPHGAGHADVEMGSGE